MGRKKTKQNKWNIFTMQPDLFGAPIAKRKVRKRVIAYQYSNGLIIINGRKYLFFSMTKAIKLWRLQNMKSKY